MRTTLRRVLGVGLILGALMLAVPSSVLAAEGDQKITVSLIQAALIGFGYYLSQGPWLFGMGFFTLYRPLVAGLIVGIILGDPGKGTLVGAAINLIYLGFISAGGSIPGDPALAGWVGTTLALAGNLDYGAALALAVPIGLLGTVIWNARMTGDTVFVHYADRKADEANIGEVARANWLYPQVYLFLITFVPVFLAANFGVTFVTDILNGLPVWVLNGLAVAGGVLPAIGIAMNMRFIFRGAVIPYFFLGYFLYVVTAGSLSMAVIAVIGLALAALHVYYVGDRESGAALQAAAAGK
ncbi:MAG: PTS sugar transporter subunit IIC [Chloroflexota bacterium]|nr:MAG: PTS sugar transporter subunit IIC [Chloroflexota bacterium]